VTALCPALTKRMITAILTLRIGTDIIELFSDRQAKRAVKRCNLDCLTAQKPSSTFHKPKQSAKGQLPRIKNTKKQPRLKGPETKSILKGASKARSGRITYLSGLGLEWLSFPLTLWLPHRVLPANNYIPKFFRCLHPSLFDIGLHSFTFSLVPNRYVLSEWACRSQPGYENE